VFPGAVKLAFDISFKVRFGNRSKRDFQPAAGPVVENNRGFFETNYSSPKVPLVVDGDPGLNSCRLARKPVVIGQFVKPTLQSRRRNLERVSRVNEILDVQSSADLGAHVGTIVVSYASRFINEHPNYGMTFRPGYFRMNQLDPVVDGGLLGNLTNALYNRS